jgi:hypothetical protein
MAASFVGAVLVAGTGGWFANALQRPSLDSTETAIFDMQPLTRSDECTQLPVAANTRAVVLRVTKVDSQRHVVAVDDAGEELKAGLYNAREQRDGSWVLRFESDRLQREPAYIVTRGESGGDEAMGCVAAAVAPPPAG